MRIIDLLERGGRSFVQLVDGKLARLPVDERRRLRQLQLETMRRPVSAVMLLFAVLAALKFAIIRIGLDSHGFGFGVVAEAAGVVVLLLLAAWFPRIENIHGREAGGVVFLLGFMFVVLGPVDGWQAAPGLSVAGVLLLPPIILPLMIRRQAAWAVIGICSLMTIALVWHSRDLPLERHATLVFFFVLSCVSGLVLRRSRSDVAVDTATTLQSAWLRAITDPLTGLLNRQGWSRQAPDALAAALMGGDHPALLFLDIDNFKRLNDTHGHAVGDQVLTTLGKIVTSRLGEDDLGARLGGEELVCLLPHSSDQMALRHANRLRLAFRARAREYGATVSIGVTRYTPGDDLGEMMGRADAAMYAAKRQGRNRVVLVGPDGCEVLDDVPHRRRARPGPGSAA